MSTVGEIVASALWLLRIVDPEDSPEPAQYERCIETLNRTMARMEANRVAIGWAPVSQPDDPFPLAPQYEDLAIHVLAVAVRPVYGASIDPDVLQRHRELLSDLHRDMAVNSPIQSNHSLPSPDAVSGYVRDVRNGIGW
jgi:hypothetical protein